MFALATDPTSALDDLDDAALDRLPFGVIGVGVDGTVIRYNRAEAERAGFTRWRVIGRELGEVAAAMSAWELAARVRAFIAAGEPRARFTCSVRRRTTRRDLVVELVRGAGLATYVCLDPG